MDSLALHTWAVWTELGLAAATFAALLFVRAPYGRHARAGWGPTVPSRLGWVVMETPAVVVFLWIYLQGAHRADLVPLLFLGLWQLHYVHRTYVLPFRQRHDGRRMPALIPALAVAFNLLNATVNARWISHLGAYPPAWLHDPRFLVGTTLFFAGFTANVHSDYLLVSLRRPVEAGYNIPRGGLFRWISAPNYLGEIVEWTGWAVLTWSWAGAAFALYTVANLAARALSNHRWYRDRFPDYTPERRALNPYLL